MLSSLMMMFFHRVMEEYNLVANPIYNISEYAYVQCTASTPGQRVQRTLTTTTTTARGDEAVIYINLHGNKPSTSISDTPAASQLATDV